MTLWPFDLRDEEYLLLLPRYIFTRFSMDQTTRGARSRRGWDSPRIGTASGPPPPGRRRGINNRLGSPATPSHLSFCPAHTPPNQPYSQIISISGYSTSRRLEEVPCQVLVKMCVLRLRVSFNLQTRTSHHSPTFNPHRTSTPRPPTFTPPPPTLRPTPSRSPPTMRTQPTNSINTSRSANNPNTTTPHHTSPVDPLTPHDNSLLLSKGRRWRREERFGRI